MAFGMKMFMIEVATFLPLALGDVALQKGTYDVENVNSGMYLNVEGGSEREGANVWIWANPGSEDSQWRFRQTEDGSAFTVQNEASGHYLSVEGGSTNTGANVVAVSDSTSLASHWIVGSLPNDEGMYTLKSALGGLYLNVEGGGAEKGTNVQVLDDGGMSNHSQWKLTLSQCEDVEAPSMCYNDTMWAKEKGISWHPEWYPGLTAESDTAEFQALLHYCYWRHCPLPCGYSKVHDCAVVAPTCEDVTGGSSRCWTAIEWAMDHGIHLKPEWYLDLDETSSVKQFQERLYEGQLRGDESHGCPQPCCHDARPGEFCYEDAKAVRDSNTYPLPLTNESDLAEFQAYVHLCHPQRCPEPCVATEMMSRGGNLTLDCPEV